MSSAQSLREFITERLTAAAAEIFSEFEKTIVRYEEKIDRQRRLLELSWKPQLDLHRIELPLHDVRKDEEVQMGQQLWNQERTSSLDQEQAEHPLVKVEQDEPEPLQILEQGELSISQEDEEQFVLKQEMITSLVTPADEERDQNEPEPDTHQLLFSLFPETETRTAAPPGSTESTSMTSFPEQSELLSNESSDYQETVILTERPSSKRLRLDTEAKHLVNSILIMKPGGERIINEYNRFKSLSDETRRKMVNILVAHMTEKNGTSPHREVKAMYARGIVSLFPNLSDPFSRTGYEHYYDSFSGTGYLAWRIKTLQRSAARGRRSSFGAASEGAPREDGLGGPAAKRDPQFVPETVLSEDECKNAIALIKHSADEDTIKKMMKLTFDFRRNIVLDPEKSNNILSVFPRFRDVKGLVEQDFVLMFGDDVSSNFLEKWTSTFKKKIIQQCRRLPSTSELENLLLAADSSEDATEVDYDTGWDSDLSSILLLLHLIPPSAQGRKRPGKVSASQAETHLVVFKTGTNIQEHLDSITTSSHPYLLAVGRSRKEVHQFFIILDKNAITCRSASSLGAFDELFKAHYVFGTTYNPMLHNMFTFIQTTVYNIDVGKVKESPRVAEVRARLLH